jgi:hypothetical protein
VLTREAEMAEKVFAPNQKQQVPTREAESAAKVFAPNQVLQRVPE